MSKSSKPDEQNILKLIRKILTSFLFISQMNQISKTIAVYFFAKPGKMYKFWHKKNINNFTQAFQKCLCNNTHVHAKSLQSPTLCNPTDCSPPGSSVYESLQARILDWVAMPFSRESSQPRNRTSISYILCMGRQGLYH